MRLFCGFCHDIIGEDTEVLLRGKVVGDWSGYINATEVEPGDTWVCPTCGHENTEEV